MQFKAEIRIMPHEALLDPQGKAVTQSMPNVGLPEITNVRIGKHISLLVEANSEEEARKKAEQACTKLLVNPITEFSSIQIFSEETVS